MPSSKIIDKIHKLLAMQAGGTEHEAAIAAQKVQELLTLYSLSLAEVQPPTQPEIIEESLGEQFTRLPAWRKVLLKGVAIANYCEVLISFQGKKRCFILVGRPIHTAIAKEMYGYLCTAIDRSLKVEHPSQTQAFGNAFRVGAAQRLAQRLEEKLQTILREGIEDEGVPALVAQSFYAKTQGELEAYTRRFQPHHWKGRYSSPSGYEAGLTAGSNISLHNQLAAPSKEMGTQAIITSLEA